MVKYNHKEQPAQLEDMPWLTPRLLCSAAAVMMAVPGTCLAINTGNHGSDSRQ